MSFLSYYTLDDTMPIELIIDETVPVEEHTETPAQQVRKSVTGILYHLRFTFRGDWLCDPTDLGFQKRWLKTIVAILTPYIQDDIYIAAIEHFKKGMEVATPHIHMLFLSRTDKETIRKQFIRKMNQDGGNVTGNKLYSLQAFAENTRKAWAYPLKQQCGETKRYSQYGKGTSFYMAENFDKTINQLRDEAYAVWLTACEVTNAKAQKADDKKELQDRLFNYLDKLDSLDNQSLKVGIQKFYIIEEKKPFNKATALGYFYNYKITKGLMTHEELAQLW